MKIGETLFDPLSLNGQYAAKRDESYLLMSPFINIVPFVTLNVVDNK